ncbi:hypothetical protein KP626_05285 [Christensenella sp. MSJ-20]|uniref:V-type ATP synthase subunit E n=1 Tax=Christensenella sp. MSJ-20 TaxID=2841518 RepID=UPI001C758F36|nr:hypothetical protein KP626_05285 [Christensenella sp. MSJ-20]
MTEKITQRILEEAREKAQAIRAEAESAAGSVVSEARERAQILTQKAEAAAKDSLSDAERRFVAVAELDAKKYRLGAKIQVLDEAFREAESAFLAMEPAAYRAVYERIVLSAVSSGREGIAPAADETRLDQGFVDGVNATLRAQGRTGELVLMPKREDISGGLILLEGSMEINLSTAAVMRQVREEIEGQTADLLFGQEEA